MAIINKNTNHKYWRICGEKRTLIHCWWEDKPAQPVWKTIGRFLKKLKTELSFDPAILLLGIYLPQKEKKIRILIQKDIHTSTFKAALLIIANIWKQPEGPPTKDMVYKYTGIILNYKKKNEVLQQFGYT